MAGIGVRRGGGAAATRVPASRANTRSTSTGPLPGPAMPELGRGRVGQVDHAPVVEGPAVVHAHHDRLAGLEARHARVAGDGQRLVRRRHREHVVDLARGRLLAVELAPVPRGEAALLHRVVVHRRGVGPPEDGVGAVGVAVVGLVARDRVGDRRRCPRAPSRAGRRRSSRPAWAAAPWARCRTRRAPGRARASRIARISSTPAACASRSTSGCRTPRASTAAPCRRSSPSAAARRPPAGSRSPCPCSRRRR